MNRIKKANSLYCTINNIILGQKVKLKIYNGIAASVITYASKSWVIEKKFTSKITAREMKYLRKIDGQTQ